MDENEIKTFDDAQTAAQQLFANTEEAPPAVVEENQPQNTDVPPSGNISQNNGENTLETAVATAEQTLAMLQQERAANEQLRQRLAEMEKASAQQSEQVAEAEENRALNDEMPTLDLSGMAFDDDETIRRKQAEYTQKVLDYSQKRIMNELEPYIAEAREGLAAKERAQTLSQLGQIPQLAGLEESIGDVENIIANNPIFSAASDMPLTDKYINAYMLLKGLNNVNTPPSAPTNDDFMKMYHESPELQEMIEKERIAKLNTANSQQIPVFSASSGAANAALNIKEKPKTFEDASKIARSFFGGK